jgi:hypothetical protein
MQHTQLARKAMRRFAAWILARKAQDCDDAMNRLLATLLVGSIAVGCGGSSSTTSDGFGSEPLMTMTSDSGNFRIDVRTAPTQPPSRGEQSVELIITDAASGAPKTGLQLDAVPWMPAMGHGASVTPSTTEKSPGTYVIEDVDFFMPGTWELRTSISGSVTDKVAPSFQIP